MITLRASHVVYANQVRVANRVNFGPLRALHKETCNFINRVREGTVGNGTSAVGIYASYAGQNELDRFVREVHNSLDWSQFVCWPMRERHNAGTGTTLYSLGGLGTFDGTLVNGPTWGENGMQFIGASSTRVFVPAFSLPDTHQFSVGAFTTHDLAYLETPIALEPFGHIFINANAEVTFDAPWAGGAGRAWLSGSQPSGYRFLFGVKNLSGQYTRLFRNGAEIANKVNTTTFGTPIHSVAIGAQASGNRASNSKIAFACATSYSLPNAKVLQLWKLLQTTILWNIVE